MIGRVFVVPKQEVLDPQGQAIRHSLHLLGFGDVTDVRLGKFLELQLAVDDPEAARRRIDEMCQRLLANQVIEDYRIEVAPDPEDAQQP